MNDLKFLEQRNMFEDKELESVKERCTNLESEIRLMREEMAKLKSI